MPSEEIRFMPKQDLMQANEIFEIASVFVENGVKKIRLTGGEPLVRKDADQIIRKLSSLPVELTITTNGFYVDSFVNRFKEAGIKSVNLSLDTLKKEKFATLTQRNAFEKVWNNLNLLIHEGFHVKVNAVIMKGENDVELFDFVQLTEQLPIHVRFIEFMPFSGNLWDGHRVFTLKEMLDQLSEKFDFLKLIDEKHDTAKKYQVPGFKGTFAIISTMSQPFCHDCNRLRLTADGKMKNCLFSNGETDLLSSLRNGENILPLIKQCLEDKKERLGGQFVPDPNSIDAQSIENRSMINIGG